MDAEVELGYPVAGTEEEVAPEEVPEEYLPEAETVRSPWWAPLRDTRVWGLVLLRGYLAFVFLQAALGHLGTPPAVLVGQWGLSGPFADLGSAAQANPTGFVDLVVGLEIALALSLIVGLATRLAGLGGFVLNLFFFFAFESADAGQLYLSWDAGLAVLWLLVLLWAPGRYLGVGQYLVARWPRLGAFLA